MRINALRGEAAVAGTDLVLVYDVSALCYAESALGRTTDRILADVDAMEEAGAIDLTLLRALYWAGLQRRHDCDLDGAADLMPSLDVARDAVLAGLRAAFGVAEEAPDPRQTGDGNGSTSSGDGAQPDSASAISGDPRRG